MKIRERLDMVHADLTNAPRQRVQWALEAARNAVAGDPSPVLRNYEEAFEAELNRRDRRNQDT